jgi:tetratricopeptide (TPR) repeat protein
VWFKRGELVNAEQAFLAAVKEYPYAPALNGIGFVAFRRGHYAVAETWFTKAIEAKATYKFAWYNRALMRTQLKKYDAALADVEEALHLDPDWKMAVDLREKIEGRLAKRRENTEP